MYASTVDSIKALHSFFNSNDIHSFDNEETTSFITLILELILSLNSLPHMLYLEHCITFYK